MIIPTNSSQFIKFYKIKYLNQCNRFENSFFLDVAIKSRSYGIDAEILFGILILEKLNRGNLLVRVLEILGVYLIPWYLIKKNVSIGLGQVKIGTAREVLGNLKDKEILRVLINQSSNIEIVARLLRKYSDNVNREEDLLKTVSNLYITGKEKPFPNFQTEVHYLLLKWSVKNNIFRKQFLRKIKKVNIT
ncbi:hypothetical protein ACQKDB_17820 [Planococcus kocurii]|uniref:hypothetical protein n=1 Tax=Planococcus kocurii TaxID=1374 RepID=UPI003D060E4A